MAFYVYSGTSATASVICDVNATEYDFLNGLAEINQGRAYPVSNSNFEQVLLLSNELKKYEKIN